MNQRIEWIDVLKVLTMILVILGHCTYLKISTSYGGTLYLNLDASLIRALGTTIGAIFVIYSLKRYKILKQ